MKHPIFTKYISKLLAVLVILSFLGASLPPAAALAADSTTVKITATKSGNKLTIDVTNAQKNSVYFVKVDDADKAGVVWSKVGTLETNKNKAGDGTYTLPSSLASATNFNICLKNTATDELLCDNPKLSKGGSSSGGRSSGTSSTDSGTFTATRSSNYIVIKTTGYPKNGAYNVRVGDSSKKGRPTFYVIGNLKTRSNTSSSYTFYLTHKLKDAPQLTVCLKNVITDKKLCVTNVQ